MGAVHTDPFRFHALDIHGAVLDLLAVAEQFSDMILGLSVFLQIRILHKAMCPADQLHQTLIVLLTVFSYQCHKSLLLKMQSPAHRVPQSSPG